MKSLILFLTGTTVFLAIPAAVAEGRQWATNSQTNHDRLMWADVTRVEPVTSTRTLPPTDQACYQRKPKKSAGLSALLAWDLLIECEPQVVTDTLHYNVHYRWGDKDYNYTSKTLPENRVRVRVGVAPM